jgi:hypothetical protein
MMIRLDSPEQQIGFAFSLQEARERMLVDALHNTIEQIDLATLDSQLHQYAEAEALKRLAAFGLRGELLFAVPCVLEKVRHSLDITDYYLGIVKKRFR